MPLKLSLTTFFTVASVFLPEQLEYTTLLGQECPSYEQHFEMHLIWAYSIQG